jgi:hypothetical protein
MACPKPVTHAYLTLPYSIDVHVPLPFPPSGVILNGGVNDVADEALNLEISKFLDHTAVNPMILTSHLNCI